jgi:hypothetical protein
MDVIELLRRQHDELRQRFDRLEVADLDWRHHELEVLTDAIALHLQLHERHLSPVLLPLGLDGQHHQAMPERHTISRVLDELAAGGQAMPPAPLIELLRATVIGHCEREEQRLFPAILRRLGQVKQELAQAIRETTAAIENDNWLGARGVRAW